MKYLNVLAIIAGKKQTHKLAVVMISLVLLLMAESSFASHRSESAICNVIANSFIKMQLWVSPQTSHKMVNLQRLWWLTYKVLAITWSCHVE